MLLSVDRTNPDCTFLQFRATLRSTIFNVATIIDSRGDLAKRFLLSVTFIARLSNHDQLTTINHLERELSSTVRPSHYFRLVDLRHLLVSTPLSRQILVICASKWMICIEVETDARTKKRRTRKLSKRSTFVHTNLVNWVPNKIKIDQGKNE